ECLNMNISAPRFGEFYMANSPVTQTVMSDGRGSVLLRVTGILEGGKKSGTETYVATDKDAMDLTKYNSLLQNESSAVVKDATRGLKNLIWRKLRYSQVDNVTILP